jgi:hypothetical protein
MPGHSRSKNGVASLAYMPGIHVFATFLGPHGEERRHSRRSLRALGCEATRLEHRKSGSPDLRIY